MTTITEADLGVSLIHLLQYTTTDFWPRPVMETYADSWVTWQRVHTCYPTTLFSGCASPLATAATAAWTPFARAVLAACPEFALLAE
jgi:hypothetical protein